MKYASAVAALLALLVAGCTSVTDSGAPEYGYAAPKRVAICHGYGCSYRAMLNLTAADGQKFQEIFAGADSAAAERTAISQANQYFEERTYSVTGVRDQPSGKFGAARIRGQMDCIDESTNTRTFLMYLSERGLLKHHKLMKNVSRGFLLDGRYPHWSAVVRDTATGVDWVVDSYYTPMGAPPDIMTLADWKLRGVLETGAVSPEERAEKAP